jgi:AhpD family alkylhydroperoxidase
MMKSRFNYSKAAPGIYEAMDVPDQYIQNCALEKPLVFLIQLRASQINGCAYCIDMHSKDLREIGDSEQRLYSLDAWRECPYYTSREKAALAWTEAVTQLSNGHVSDAVYEEVRSYFNETELCDLTFVISTINAWNRLCIASRLVPGNYQPAKVESVNA